MKPLTVTRGSAACLSCCGPSGMAALPVLWSSAVVSETAVTVPGAAVRSGQLRPYRAAGGTGRRSASDDRRVLESGHGRARRGGTGQVQGKPDRGRGRRARCGRAGSRGGRGAGGVAAGGG